MVRRNKIEWDAITRIVDFIRVNGSVAPLGIQDIYDAADESLMVYGGIDIVLHTLIDLDMVEETYASGHEGRRQFLWLNIK